VNEDHVGLVVGRQVLAELVKNLGDGVVSDRNVHKKIIEQALEIVQPRLVSFEEQASVAIYR
jgi:COP9 signalosome complex subunit 4